LVELKGKASSRDGSPSRPNCTGRNLQRRSLLRALEYEKPCVLLIDELDKVDKHLRHRPLSGLAACFGLGRYLYYFTGMWVDLDQGKRPKSLPRVFGWATPKLAAGLRPRQGEDDTLPNRLRRGFRAGVTSQGKDVNLENQAL